MAAENKTQRTKAGAGAFISKIKEPKRRAECQALVKLMEEASGEKPASMTSSACSSAHGRWAGLSVGWPWMSRPPWAPEAHGSRPFWGCSWWDLPQG